MVMTSWSRFAAPSSPAKFIENRLRPIVPAYYIATLTMLVVLFAVGQAEPRIATIIASLLFLPDPLSHGGNMNPVLNVGWSLNAEMFFYAAFVIGLFFRRRVGLTVVFGIVAAAMVAGFVSERALGAAALPALSFYAQRVMLMFPLGMMLAVAEKQQKLPSILRRLPSEAVVAAGVLLIAAFDRVMPGKYPLWRMAVSFIISAWAVAACIDPARPAWFSKAEKILDVIGDRSYSIYLFHLPILTLAIAGFTAVFGRSNPWQMPVSGLIAAAGAFFSYLLAEAPFRKSSAPGKAEGAPLLETVTGFPTGR